MSPPKQTARFASLILFVLLHRDNGSREMRRGDACRITKFVPHVVTCFSRWGLMHKNNIKVIKKQKKTGNILLLETGCYLTNSSSARVLCNRIQFTWCLMTFNKQASVRGCRNCGWSWDKSSLRIFLSSFHSALERTFFECVKWMERCRTWWMRWMIEKRRFLSHVLPSANGRRAGEGLWGWDDGLLLRLLKPPVVAYLLIHRHNYVPAVSLLVGVVI